MMIRSVISQRVRGGRTSSGGGSGKCVLQSANQSSFKYSLTVVTPSSPCSSLAGNHTQQNQYQQHTRECFNNPRNFFHTTRSLHFSCNGKRSMMKILSPNSTGCIPLVQQEAQLNTTKQCNYLLETKKHQNHQCKYQSAAVQQLQLLSLPMNNGFQQQMKNISVIHKTYFSPMRMMHTTAITSVKNDFIGNESQKLSLISTPLTAKTQIQTWPTSRTPSYTTTTTMPSSFIVNQRCFYSSTNRSYEESKSQLGGGGGFTNKNEKNDFKMSEIYTSVPFVSLVAMLTALSIPTIFDSMKESNNQYKETDVEDDMYRQLRRVSNEIQGQLLNAIIGTSSTEEYKINNNINNSYDESNDPSSSEEDENRTSGNTADIVADVLNSDALQNAIANLISRVIGSAQVQGACQKLLRNLWDDLVQDPETTAQVVQLLNTAVENEKIKRSFKELIMGLLKDEDIYKELTSLVVRLGEEQEVLDATKELLTESTHNALNDPEILDHSMEFATDVVGDDVVQRTSGEALRNTVTYAVRPGLSAFLSFFGVCLLYFSVSAVGNARSSAKEGEILDAAASTVIKNLGRITLHSLSKLLSIPYNVLSQLATKTFNMVTNRPSKLTKGIITSIENHIIGLAHLLQNTLASVLQLPGSLLRRTSTNVSWVQEKSYTWMTQAVIYLGTILQLGIQGFGAGSLSMLQKACNGIKSGGLSGLNAIWNISSDLLKSLGKLFPKMR